MLRIQNNRLPNHLRLKDGQMPIFPEIDLTKSEASNMCSQISNSCLAV